MRTGMERTQENVEKHRKTSQTHTAAAYTTGTRAPILQRINSTTSTRTQSIRPEFAKAETQEICRHEGNLECSNILIFIALIF
jgi:hypothetical protein